MTINKVLTTGEIATYCDVSPRTVSKWIDNKDLKGFRLPSTADRRVFWKDFVEFCDKVGYPKPGLDMKPAEKVYVYDKEGGPTTKIDNFMYFDSDFNLGVACVKEPPKLIIVFKNTKLVRELETRGYTVVNGDECNEKDIADIIVSNC